MDLLLTLIGPSSPCDKFTPKAGLYRGVCVCPILPTRRQLSATHRERLHGSTRVQYGMATSGDGQHRCHIVVHQPRTSLFCVLRNSKLALLQQADGMCRYLVFCAPDTHSCPIEHSSGQMTTRSYAFSNLSAGSARDDEDSGCCDIEAVRNTLHTHSV